MEIDQSSAHVEPFLKRASHASRISPNPSAHPPDLAPRPPSNLIPLPLFKPTTSTATHCK